MSWRFALTPTWLVRHLLVAALIVAMISAGLWQLRRLDEKQTYKALVEARQEEPVAEVTDVVPAGAGVGDVAVRDVLYRQVRATGRYVLEDTVVVENRTYNAAPGAWVLTPLELDDGTAVLVNRGFVGFDRDGQIVAPAPPAGQVTVEGLLFPSQSRGSFGPTDPAEGRLEVMARVDIDRLDEQVEADLLPTYIQLVTSDPAEPAAAPGAPQLVALGPPTPDEGPHLSYAVQWLIFTLIATGGYGLLLRRVARDRGREASANGGELHERG